MGQPLQLLEGDRVGPDQADVAAVAAQRALRRIAVFRQPGGMEVGDIVPVHQQGLIARIQILRHQAAGIGLLIRPAPGLGSTPSISR